MEAGKAFRPSKAVERTLALAQLQLRRAKEVLNWFLCHVVDVFRAGSDGLERFSLKHEV